MLSKKEPDTAGSIVLVPETVLRAFLDDQGYGDASLRETEAGYEICTELDSIRLEQLRCQLDAEFSLFFDPRALLPQESFVEELKGAGIVSAVGESCTGGLLGSLITSVPGASDVFWGGIISYDDQVKTMLLGVGQETLSVFGAVSAQVVREMVYGLLDFPQIGIGISVSGIAGPDGGRPDKPVGTVWIGVGSKDRDPQAYKLLFTGTRNQIRYKAAVAALLLSRSFLRNENLDTNRNWQYT